MMLKGPALLGWPGTLRSRPLQEAFCFRATRENTFQWATPRAQVEAGALTIAVATAQGGRTPRGPRARPGRPSVPDAERV